MAEQVTQDKAGVMSVVIRSMKIQDGDIVTMRYDEGSSYEEMKQGAEAFSEGLRALDIHAYILMIRGDDSPNIEVIDESEMNRLGWYRKEGEVG